MQAGAFDYWYTPFRLCLCQTFFISTLLGEKLPIQQLPCEAENANACVCCTAPPAGKTEALCREISVLSTPPFQVEYAPISHFYIIRVGWSHQRIESLNLWLAWLWLSPAVHLTIHHATLSAIHTAEDVTYQRINPWSCHKFNIIHYISVLL